MISMRHAPLLTLILLVSVYITFGNSQSDEIDVVLSNVDIGESLGDENNIDVVAPSRKSVNQKSDRGAHHEQNVNGYSIGTGSGAAADSTTPEPISIGDYLDPNDTALFDDKAKHPISIGVILSADDDADWPQIEVEPIALGYLKNPDSTQSQEVDNNAGFITIGERIDVERVLGGDALGASTEFTTPIVIGPLIKIPN
jgi:hypothetical protein